jgi:hypothetical protein
MSETHLYRCFDGGGRLLYVGAALSAFKRLKQHASSSSWFRAAKTITLQAFPNREAALTAEAKAIRVEEPIFNIALAAEADPRLTSNPRLTDPKLTEATAANAQAPAAGCAFIRDKQLVGFALRITANGWKSFVVEGRVNGRTRRYTIGRADLWAVEDARGEARQILADMKRGIDPKTRPRAPRALERDWGEEMRL